MFGGGSGPLPLVYRTISFHCGNGHFMLSYWLRAFTHCNSGKHAIFNRTAIMCSYSSHHTLSRDQHCIAYVVSPGPAFDIEMDTLSTYRHPSTRDEYYQYIMMYNGNIGKYPPIAHSRILPAFP